MQPHLRSPDRPAIAASVPVHQPRKKSAPPKHASCFSNSPPLQLIIAYGQIIPRHPTAYTCQRRLSNQSPRCPSSSQKYRGAAPIQLGLANGETQTGLPPGVSTRLWPPTAPLSCNRIAYIAPMKPPRASPPSLAEARLAADAAPNPCVALTPNLAPRSARYRPATYSPSAKRKTAAIDGNTSSQPNKSITACAAFTPWPGAYNLLRQQTCHLLWAEPFFPANAYRHAPEPFFARHKIFIACGHANNDCVSIRQTGSAHANFGGGNLPTAPGLTERNASTTPEWQPSRTLGQ